ncbi:hypothetical protein OGATHE_003122 [Ogataea polymorpha]|uniref:Uncharacterized protein n=1 Tax=Ogataea polymorpha TaxID=460523 RepID=A0A9P8P9W9_9ASCO|nr:hypothetical protein OGATHE_003122 [Ogataea polymorpha]
MAASWTAQGSWSGLGELNWVPDEEDRRVVVHKVQVSVFCVEFGSKSPWVSGCVCRTFFSTHSGESGENSCLLTNSVEELGTANIGNVVGHFKHTVSSGTLGVHHSLWNSFSVKVGECVNELEVLQEQWTNWRGILVARGIQRDPLGGEGIRHGTTLRILVHCNLGVSNCIQVLDHNAVVDFSAQLVVVQNLVRRNHVVHHRRLGDLLGPELSRRREIVSVVVSQMVVRCNGNWPNSRIDQKLCQHRLQLGLTALEVVSANVGAVIFGKLNNSRNESVLWTSVDVRDVLQDTGHGKHRARRDLLVVLLDGLEQDDDLVELVGGLEVADILSDLLNMAPLAGGVNLTVNSVEAVICSFVLVGSNEVWVINRLQRHDLLHLLFELLLKVVLQDLCLLHGDSEIVAVDVPAANDKIVRVHHRKQRIEGSIHILALGVDAELDGGRLSDRAVVIGSLEPLFCVELQLVPVGKDGSNKRGSVVSS